MEITLGLPRSLKTGLHPNLYLPALCLSCDDASFVEYSSIFQLEFALTVRITNTRDFDQKHHSTHCSWYMRILQVLP